MIGMDTKNETLFQLIGVEGKVYFCVPTKLLVLYLIGMDYKNADLFLQKLRLEHLLKRIVIKANKELSHSCAADYKFCTLYA